MGYLQKYIIFSSFMKYKIVEVGKRISFIFFMNYDVDIISKVTGDYFY